MVLRSTGIEWQGNLRPDLPGEMEDVQYAVPVIKVATRSDLARRWHDLMDINAGRIAEGQASIEDVGWELFRFMLEVASGRQKTWAERWKLHNQLVLFNPAPVT